MIYIKIYADQIVYWEVSCDRRFFTNESKTNDSTGFGVFNELHRAAHKLQSPCSVYVAKLAAILYALERIASLPSDQYFIFTDSLSSIEAIRSLRPVKHYPYFLSEIRSILSALSYQSYNVTLIWIPSHYSIPSNEKTDSLAKLGAMEGDIYDRHIAFNDFFDCSSACLGQLATKMGCRRNGQVVTFNFPTGIEDGVVQGVGHGSRFYQDNVSNSKRGWKLR